MKISENIHTLNKLLDALESDDIDLDDAVNTYSKAMKLAKKISDQLKKSEEKITVIQTEHNGTTDKEH